MVPAHLFPKVKCRAMTKNAEEIWKRSGASLVNVQWNMLKLSYLTSLSSNFTFLCELTKRPCICRRRFSGTCSSLTDVSRPRPNPGSSFAVPLSQVKYGVRSPKFIFVLHVYSCTHWLRPRNYPPLPPHLGSYTGVLLFSKDRRHLFVTPWPIWCMLGPFAVPLWMLPDAPCPYYTALYHLAELYIKLHVRDGIYGDTSLKGLFL